MPEKDISGKYQEANDFIYDCLQEHVLNTGEAPTHEEATEYVRSGVKILLDALVGEDADVDKHVGIRLEDLDGDSLKMAIHMESRSDFGKTVVALFGMDPGSQAEQLEN
jgi:hypothetical protein